ncbi:galactokinase [Akkermansiaceae bacterium]|nr:galactokinase [Akkermansiaceae bacterium]MDB4302653.1 galactokinase [bacterium]MDB4619905.1 galactokinase [Akkermansiaceae bacterium]MDB4693365.1 galactokinase [Akkermansiaceae bacterium]MDB4740625.1 galactokinase [Akkermansiaceae bacterium]
MLQENDSLATLAAAANADMLRHYGAEGTGIAAAPGRVNLIGEHIDYCDGFVLPLAIERYIVVSAKQNGSSEAHIRSGDQPEAVIDISSPQTISDLKWSNYIRGVIKGFQDLGHEIPGFDACIVSSVPSGGGLSSSAALECAMATLFEGLLGITLGIREKALLAQKAEHDFAGVPCGIMDQFASAFGEQDQLVLIDCRSGEPEMVPFSNPDLSIIVANTCVSHDLSDGGYAERRKATEDGIAIIGKESWRDATLEDVLAKEAEMGDRVFRRSRHVVGEIQRTKDAVTAFKTGDFSNIGQLMADSHASLRDDFEVSCDELDLMIEIASGLEGVLGARMTGGGFGGSTVTLCETKHAEEIGKILHQRYETKTGITPVIFATRPAKGAHLLG